MSLKLQSNIVILGGGIHGASIAYYLAKRGVRSIIVEESHIGAAASGKSGGFLARDWGHGPTKQLHEISYQMHKELAEDLHLTTYREIPTLSVNGNIRGNNVVSWLNRKSASTHMSAGTAQVTSKELTEKFIEEAAKIGTSLIIGRASKVDIIENVVSGVHVDGHGFIPAEKVIVCLGPWSGVFCEDNFNVTMPMEGIKSTSIIYKNVEESLKEPYALFCEEDINGCHLELYPRANGDLYVCGCGGSDYVKGDRLRLNGDCEKASVIMEDRARVQAAVTSIKSMSSIGDREPDVLQACMRPCMPDGLPVMGEISAIKGAYISAGHNCWGILWAPVSGYAMAELLTEGRCSIIDLGAFNPLRFHNKSSARGKKKGNLSVGEQW